MGGQNGFIIHHYNRQYQIYPDFTYFCARIMNLQMETVTDNNEMNAGNGTPCCHCHGEECRCREENGECECHCHAHETLYPGVTCIDVEPDDFNDWD